jgi:hypothetical protein
MVAANEQRLLVNGEVAAGRQELVGGDVVTLLTAIDNQHEPPCRSSPAGTRPFIACLGCEHWPCRPCAAVVYVCRHPRRRESTLHVVIPLHESDGLCCSLLTLQETILFPCRLRAQQLRGMLCNVPLCGAHMSVAASTHLSLPLAWVSLTLSTSCNSDAWTMACGGSSRGQQRCGAGGGGGRAVG